METLKPQLEALLASVFEQMAFMFADPAGPEPIDGKAMRVRMRYDGVQRGGLSMAVPEAMALDLSANLLGTEAGDDDALDHAGDALREMLNVLCGHVVTLLAGPDALFDLSPPELEPGTPAEWDAWSAEPGVVTMSVDGHPVLLQLHREEA